MNEHRAAIRQTGQRIGERVLLHLLEDNRVVQHRGSLFGDALEQPTVIVAIVVPLEVVQREAADERVVELQRADDGRLQGGRRRGDGGAERAARVRVDERPAVAHDPAQDLAADFDR